VQVGYVGYVDWLTVVESVKLAYVDVNGLGAVPILGGRYRGRERGLSYCSSERMPEIPVFFMCVPLQGMMEDAIYMNNLTLRLSSPAPGRKIL
jgi:hypothetical protein